MAKAKKGKAATTQPKIERKGPYLSVALIAERIITETDGVASFMRVIDRVGISPEMISQLKKSKHEKMGLNLTIALYFKAGGFKGSSNLLIVQGCPSGKSEPL